jgi:hypothetical protein
MNVPRHLWMPILLRSLGGLTSSLRSTRSSPHPHGTGVHPNHHRDGPHYPHDSARIYPFHQDGKTRRRCGPSTFPGSLGGNGL